MKLRNVPWCQLKCQMTKKLTVVICTTVKCKSISPGPRTPTHGLSLYHITCTFCTLAIRKTTKRGTLYKTTFYINHRRSKSGVKRIPT